MIRLSLKDLLCILTGAVCVCASEVASLMVLRSQFLSRRTFPEVDKCLKTSVNVNSLSWMS